MNFKKGDIVWYNPCPHNDNWTRKKLVFIEYVNSNKTLAVVELLVYIEGHKPGTLCKIGTRDMVRVFKSKRSHLPSWF